MSETLYLQINRNIEVAKRDVTIGDVASVLCKNAAVMAKVKTLKLLSVPDVKKKRVCVSVMQVIEIIHQEYPDIEINNVGENDFIVDYIREKKHNTVLQWLLIAFVALFTFVGSVYAIMAYNNDVNTTEIFEKMYTLFDTPAAQEYKLIEIAYAVGLAAGIIVFYNHFGGKRFTTDPTPIEVEMDKYEKDIDDTMIDRSAAANKEKTV